MDVVKGLRSHFKTCTPHVHLLLTPFTRFVVFRNEEDESRNDKVDKDASHASPPDATTRICTASDGNQRTCSRVHPAGIESGKSGFESMKSGNVARPTWVS
jgi:hypothetical protein